MKTRNVAVLTTGAALCGALVTGTVVRAATEDVTYYACLKGGSLSQVGTTVPTCSKGGVVIDWNSVGPQGPPGADGAAGPTGATGAAGANGISGYFTYSGTPAVLDGSPYVKTVATYWAGCPGGRVPIGGGYKYTEGVPDTVRVVGEHIVRDPFSPTATAWGVEVEVKPEGANAGSTITVSSICAYAN